MQQAVDAALTEARAEFERIRASDHADHARQLGERERQIAEQTTDVIVERLAAGLATINETVGHHVARVLARFLESAVRERAIDELSETLAALLADGHATQIRVSGPADLVERLRSVATTAGVSLEAVIGESADVRVTVDDTSIETRIRAWMERTLAAVGDGPDG